MLFEDQQLFEKFIVTTFSVRGKKTLVEYLNCMTSYQKCVNKLMDHVIISVDKAIVYVHVINSKQTSFNIFFHVYVLWIMFVDFSLSAA